MNKKLLVLGLATLLAGAGGWYYLAQRHAVPVATQQEFRPYETAAHKAFIHKQFRENWYILISSPEYDVDYMLDTHSPNGYEPLYKGKMDITVQYEEGQPVGFGTYYMRHKAQGEILFIDIDKEFRGKGYALKLVNYVIEQLKNKGAQVIKLATRVENKIAQSLYEKVGFKRVKEERGFVYYRKEVKSLNK